LDCDVPGAQYSLTALSGPKVGFIIAQLVLFGGLFGILYAFYPPESRAKIMVVAGIVAVIAMAGGWVTFTKMQRRKSNAGKE
jgi:hypothetical protein